jgi:hypothetical protein
VPWYITKSCFGIVYNIELRGRGVDKFCQCALTLQYWGGGGGGGGKGGGGGGGGGGWGGGGGVRVDNVH